MTDLLLFYVHGFVLTFYLGFEVGGSENRPVVQVCSIGAHAAPHLLPVITRVALTYAAESLRRGCKLSLPMVSDQFKQCAERSKQGIRAVRNWPNCTPAAARIKVA